MNCSIVIVGDEILAGHVVDANAPFLIEQIVAAGHRVHRVVIVEDDVEVIARETSEQIATSELVFVCGGLGPTHDDVTAEGVARALGTDLQLCAALAAQIEATVASVQERGFSETSFGADGFRKMAMAPEGAEALVCDAGVMPAFAVSAGDATVIMLPGPPRELRAMVTQAVVARFLGGGTPSHRRELTHPYPEATLASLLSELADAVPQVSIGSYPRAGDSLIRVTGPQEHVDRVAERIAAFIDAIGSSEEGRRLAEFMAARRSSRQGIESG